MKKNVLLLLFLISGISSLYAQYPVVNTARPRIYADSSRLAWLSTNITVTGDCQTTYNNFKYAYDNWWINDPQLYLLGNDSTVWNWDWNSQWAKDEAMFTVFIYKLTNDSLALKRCRYLAREVILQYDTNDFANMSYWPKEGLLRKLSDCGDLILDWCYNDLPDTLVHQLERSIYSGTREFMNTYILSASGNSYVSSHNPWNTIFCNQNILTLYHAEALDSLQQDTLRQWFEVIYDKWENGFLPCYSYYRDDDGGWNWGAAYSMWSLIDQFQLFENMRIATNKNYYADVPWVQNSINQYWYFIQPDGKSLHLGDGVARRTGDRVDYLHARIYNDPRSQWLAQYWSQPANTPNTADKFVKLLYKDFGMPTVPMPAVPLNWQADKVGLSVSRSSWNNDATMVTFFNSPSKRSDHEHRDNNSFTVFKNTPLLLDAGYYDTYAGTHYRNYYQRTIAHNSICVYDSNAVYTNFSQAASNDGGQIESFSLQNYSEIFLPQNQRGEWIKYGTGTNYTYNVADAQLSYDTAVLDLFRRKLLYLSPDKIIVVDYVHLKNQATAQRDISWIAHFQQQPAMTGSVTSTTVPCHIITYDGNSYTSVNGTGSVAVRTVLPDSTSTTLIGGAGYEYWVDGVNYPPLTNPDTNVYSPGRWRIEVRPLVQNDTIVYCHTIKTGTAANPAVAGGVPHQNHFSVGTDWEDTLYYFSADGDTGKLFHLFYNVPGNRTVGIFAADMLYPMNYYVIVDAVVVNIQSTDSNGILQSSAVLGSGNHTVSIVTAVGIVEPLAGSIQFFYPNPSNGQINIMPFSNSEFTVEIFDLNGRLLVSEQNKTQLDVSTLSAGMYFIRMKQEGKMYSTKFIRN